MRSDIYMPVSTEPLLELLRKSYDERTKKHNTNHDRLASALGVSKHTYRKLRYKTHINWVTADRYAIRLGLHPALIWHDWYEITDPDT